MRLALAYAPARARPDWFAVLALDARLAGVVRSAREPMLAQIRLAWWRDRLRSDPREWPRGEPLLAALQAWGEQAAGLAGLVDGWEALLAEPPLDAAAMERFAAGRADGLHALAARLGLDITAVAIAARQWALADLALHLGDPDGRKLAAALIPATRLPRLTRPARPLAVLTGLSLRAVRGRRREALDGPGALLAAIRLGIAGR